MEGYYINKKGEINNMMTDTAKEALINFGHKLKEAREEENITQSDLAGMIGKYPERISLFERGIKLPSKQEFENICNLMNKTPEFFFPNGVLDLPEERQFNGNSRRGNPRNFSSSYEERQKDKDELAMAKHEEKKLVVSPPASERPIDPNTGLRMNVTKVITPIDKKEETPTQSFQSTLPKEEVFNPVVEERVENCGTNNTKRKVSISVPTSMGTSITITIEEENVRPQYNKPYYDRNRR